MAAADPEPAQSELLNDVAAAVVDRLVSPENIAKYSKAFESAATEILKLFVYVAVRIASPAAVASIEAITDVSEDTAEQRGRVLAASLRNIFGIKVEPGQFGRLFESGSSSAVSHQLVSAMLDALTGGSKSIEASDVPANRYVQLVISQALEGWVTGASVELLSAVIPGIEQIQTLGDASNRVSAALGIGDSSSRVLRPYIDTLVVEPLRRKIDSTYRPALFSAADVARHYWRGRLTREQAFAELALQGLSDAKAELLLDAARRTLSVANVRTLFDRAEWTPVQAVEHLRAQGYDDELAGLALKMELLQRQEQHESSMAAAASGAYVAGNISRAEFLGFVEDAVRNAQERSFVVELADARRVLKRKALSPAEARACVKAGILSVRDYREALEQDGYDHRAVLALELLLEAELTADRELADKRAAAEAARAEKERIRAEDAARRRVEQEAARAAARRGDEADLEAAAVRGKIPIARVEELYRARYDEETVGIYVELLDDRRAAYLDEQRRRADALRQAARRQVSIADLEAAVMQNIIDVGRFAGELGVRGFSPADIDLLVRTLEAEKADRDAAAAARRQAAAAAQGRGIDLGRFERLVLRGLRTIGQYAELLRALRFGEPAVVDMVALLQAEIDDAAAAAAEAAAADDALRPKGLSLAELRRIVVLGLAPRGTYEALLRAERYTPEAQRLLLLDLDHAIALAEDARARRNAPAPSGSDTSALPLDRLRQAARLQLVPIGTYRDRLVRDGYTADEIDTEIELLLVELADVQAARQARERAPSRDARELALPELARAVKAGLQSLEAYEARALALGFSREAVTTQLRVLGDELRATEIARARRDALGIELKGRGVTLAELEAAVTDGALSLEGFVEQLQRAGLAPEDAGLLGGLLEERLLGLEG